MQRLITFISLFSLLTLSLGVLADGDATIVRFTERETGHEPYLVRYVIGKDLLRIDDNNDDGDYVLYDDKKRVIYSVNHDDSTILVIKHSQWSLPEFKFDRNITWKKLDDAPKINNSHVYSYWLSAGETVCSEAQVVEDLLPEESALLQRYRQTLSAEQVASLVATPEDMRQPCMLVDQVYDTGEVFSKGFPVQQWHINGMQRMMNEYKTNQKVAGKLFELPAGYHRYRMGDNMTFGEPGDTPQPNETSPAQIQNGQTPAGF